MKIILFILTLPLTSCTQFTAADYARAVELVRQATTPSGK